MTAPDVDCSPSMTCNDCSKDVKAHHEYAFMLHDQKWKLACWAKPNTSPKCLLCVTCIENRIGRQLNHADFNWHWNLTRGDHERSELLKDRMGI